MTARQIALLTIAALTLQALLGSHFAIAQQDLKKAFTIEGKYDGQGFSVTIPDGWKAGELSPGYFLVATKEFIDNFNGTNPAKFGYLIITSQPTYQDATGFDPLKQEHSEGCVLTATYEGVNGIKAKHIDMSCPAFSSRDYARSAQHLDLYRFYADYPSAGQVFSVALTANDEGIYSAYLPAFKSMLQSITIAKGADMTNFEDRIFNMKPALQNATVNDQLVKIDMKSTSEIKDFKLNKETKSVSFKADASSDFNGYTMISIGSIIQGPYQATMDGQPFNGTRFYVADDQETGDNIAFMKYDRDIHNITITGTQVVPEFPVSLLGLAIAMSLTAAIVRTRIKARRTPKMSGG